MLVICQTYMLLIIALSICLVKTTTQLNIGVVETESRPIAPVNVSPFLNIYITEGFAHSSDV